MARRRTVPKTCPHTVRLGAPKTVSSRGAERLQAARNVAENRSPTSEKKRCNRIGQLSQILNIPRSSLYAYLPEGWIPCGWISNRWILPDDVEDRLRARAYENWRPPDKKRQRRCKGRDSESGSVKSPRWPASDVGAGAVAKPPRTGSVWLSPRQCARQFGIGTSAVYAAVGRGEVPAIRIGRHIRIPPETVEVLLTSTNMQGQ